MPEDSTLTAVKVVPGTDRFPPRDRERLTPAQRLMVMDIEARRGKMPAPYEVLAGSPEVAMHFESLSARLWKGALPVHILEAVFLMTARHHRCVYQWQTHRNKALEAGLTPEIIQTIGRDEPLDGVCAGHQDVLDTSRFLRALHTGHAVSDRDFEQMAAHFDEAQLSELLAFCGLAASVAMLLNVRQVAPPASGATLFG